MPLHLLNKFFFLCMAVVPYWFDATASLPSDRPFLAFVNQNAPGSQPLWPIDVSNAKPSQALGFNCRFIRRFIRNPAVALYNSQSPEDDSMITAGTQPSPAARPEHARGLQPHAHARGE